MPNYELVSPTTTTAPVAGVSAGLFTFSTPVRRLVVNNRTGAIVYLRFNSASAAAAAAGSHDLPVQDADTGRLLDAEELSINTFSTVSVWVAAGGDVSLLSLRGR